MARWFRRKDKPEDKSIAALDDAIKNLHKVKNRDCEVSLVANALKEIRELNHFGEQLEEILIWRGGPSK